MRRQLNKHLFSAFQPYWMYFNVAAGALGGHFYVRFDDGMSMHVVICKYLNIYGVCACF